MSPAGLWRFVELPLLVKELNEQAARKRTYIVRFLYALTLFTAACLIFFGGFIAGNSSDVFGRGRPMLEQLVTLQFYGIYLFLPAVTCGVLTTEKERNTLGLLLITTLRPWQIVAQKVLGRVVPMLTYVLLSFPLMAVAYSFGGVTTDYLWSATLLLLLTCFEVGALAVACSSYFATTVEAFVAHYVAFLTLWGVLPFAWGDHLFRRAAERQQSFAVTAASSVLMIFATGGFLLLAWAVLEARAFVTPRNALLGVFRRLDAWFTELNKVTGGIVLVQDGDPLPGRQPIAWRETAKKSLGTFRYLFRVLVLVELPLLFICAGLQNNARPGGASLDPITYFLYVLWLLAISMTVVHAGSVIAAERTRQTLDVLLTTPLSGREILLEKLQGVRRLVKVMLVPFFTVFAFETWWNQSATYRWVYPFLALASVAVYLPLTAWLALWVGLTVRSQMKAVLTALAAIGLWLALPAVATLVVPSLTGGRSETLENVLLLNPAVLIPDIERAGRITVDERFIMRGRLMPQWSLFAANLLLYGTALWGVRRYVLAHADRLLGRLDERPALAGDHREPQPLPAAMQTAAM